MKLIEEEKDFFLKEIEWILNHKVFKRFTETLIGDDAPWGLMDFDCEFEDTHEEYEKEIEVRVGSTKLCIMLNYDYGFDYVVKIPLLKERKTNYCQLEVDNYIKAEQKKLEHFFCVCEYLTTFLINNNSIPIYIMKRAEVDEDKVRYKGFNYFCKRIMNTIYDMNEFATQNEKYEKYYSYIYKNEYDDNVFSNEAECCFSNYYSGSEIYSLINFLYDNEINDIHIQNLGFMNGKPVLVDFSGIKEDWI